MANPSNQGHVWRVAQELLERTLPRLPDGRIDYLRLELRHLVSPGEKIATAARIDESATLTAGSGCDVSSDGSYLVAAVHGLPESGNGVIRVRPFRIIQESTGPDPLQ